MSEKERSPIGDVAKDIFDNMIKPRFLETTNNTIVELLYLLADSAVDLVSQKILGRPSSRRPAVRANGATDYRRESTAKAAASQAISGSKPSNTLDYICLPYNKIYDDIDEITGRKMTAEQKAQAIEKDLKLSIEKFGYALVSELYEKAEHKTIYTDFKFGWTDVSDIHFRPDRNGYWFDMPNPVPIKKL